MNTVSSVGLTKDQALEMLELQDTMNARVNPNWIIAGDNWMRAIMLEAAEAMEWVGWKWWKKQTPNNPQLQIELVDIWHFVLSQYLVRWEGNHDLTAEMIERQTAPNPVGGIMFVGICHQLRDLDTLKKLELMIGLAVTSSFSFTLFASIMADIGMTWDDLRIGYVAKNVLNNFRQNNGYRSGEYRKIWGGREDNEHLEEIKNNLIEADMFEAGMLYRSLDLRYKAVA